MTSRRDFLKLGLTGAAAGLAGLGLSDARGAVPGAATGGEHSGTAPRKTIDWHNHWLSPTSVEILKRRTSAPRIEVDSEGRLSFISLLPGALRLAPEFTDVDARLRHLERANIDRQVISWPTTLGVDAVLSADEARPLWKAYNDELGELVRLHPDRFAGLAAIPTSDVDWAAAELERAHRDLHLIGAVLPVGAFQSIEGARYLEPVLSVAQKYHSHIYLHTGPASPKYPGQWAPRFAEDDAPGLRRTLETGGMFATAATLLSHTDFLDSYPDVTVQIAMLGGLSAFAAGPQPFGGGARGPRASEQRSAQPAGSGFGRLYFDTGVYGRAPHIVNFAVARLGAERILFGSDFPLTPTENTVVAVRRAGLARSDLNRIFVDNGADLFRKAGKASA